MGNWHAPPEPLQNIVTNLAGLSSFKPCGLHTCKICYPAEYLHDYFRPSVNFHRFERAIDEHKVSVKIKLLKFSEQIQPLKAALIICEPKEKQKILEERFKQLELTATTRTLDQIGKLDELKNELTAKKEECGNTDWTIRVCDGCKRGERCEVVELAQKIATNQNNRNSDATSSLACKSRLQESLDSNIAQLASKARMFDAAFILRVYNYKDVCLTVQDEDKEELYSLESPVEPKRTSLLSEMGREFMNRKSRKMLISLNEDLIQQLKTTMRDIRSYTRSTQSDMKEYSDGTSEFTDNSKEDMQFASEEYNGHASTIEEGFQRLQRYLKKQERALEVLKCMHSDNVMDNAMIEEYKDSMEADEDEVKKAITLHGVPKNKFRFIWNFKEGRFNSYGESHDGDGETCVKRRNMLGKYNASPDIDAATTRVTKAKDEAKSVLRKGKNDLNKIQGTLMEDLDSININIE